MSLEARVTALGHKFEQLDHGFHENSKILEATHGVVSLILNEQREKNRRLDAFVAGQETVNKDTSRRPNKTEELLIQIVNNLASRSSHSFHASVLMEQKT